ncbi:MAG: NAD(P)H-dependent glycerol-3-phosphate dehydrogenase [Bacteroidetes bacterium]|jgi:glycerol-3-phosphate dehydrogenase (NAD(P)+)|nr:NAD(P)H-dependent glycerol-3-phosphate dehydrogenase [Bacteroidota bacterium]
MNLKIGLLGGGSWGTTVASLTAQNAPTKMWARSQKTVDDINKNHRNEKYLPGADLTKTLQATTSIKEAIQDADVIIMGVPAQSFRQVLEDAKTHIRPWVPIVSLAKGLERGTKMRMTEIIETIKPGHPAGVLTGPNLSREIIAGQAAASVIAMVDDTIANELQKVFRTGFFRVYTNDDVVGCELGGALKNIIAIAAGMGDGAGAGDNTRSAVITRGLAELTRLGVAMGGRPETFAGLAGMGDLVATCISPLSRNRSVGFKLGQGQKLDDIINEMSMVAEGVKSCSVVMELAREYNVEMPISEEVYKVVHDGNSVRDAFRGLIRRPMGSEAEPG